MAQIANTTLGIDVSKHKLDVFQWDSQQHMAIDNTPVTIARQLRQLRPGAIAVESTSDYHLAVVEQALGLGIEVYLVNARELSHYRKAVGERNKTDATDAYLLARYLDHERGQLRRHRPVSRQAQQLWTLIKRRAKVVEMKKQLRQSLGSVMSIRGALRSLDELIARIDKRIANLIRQLGWQRQYQRCLSIKGIGSINAAALVCAYHRGAFASANAFIAYLGLDIRIRESGMYRGKRKLTKHGEPEMRRLLWCAAQPATNHPPFAVYLDRQLDKGLSKIAAKVVLARKLARIAFALMRDETSFDPSRGLA